MSANPYGSYPANEFPPSGVIALFDTAKDAPEPMHPASALTSLATLAPANDTTPARMHARTLSRSRFALTLAWLRALITTLLTPTRAPPVAR